MYESIVKKIKKVKIVDLMHIFLMCIAFVVSFFYKRYRKNLFLICEYPDEAHDNAYWLFKYMSKAHKEVDVVYAIKKSSPEYSKVLELGKVVEFGSLRHWVYYLSAKANISSQKGGKPNAAICYLNEVIFNVIKTKNIFLQHGIIINSLPYLYSDRAKINLFVCSANQEYEFIKNEFGYPESVIKKVGLCRYDSLKKAEKGCRRILIAPTWRIWLSQCKNCKEFKETDFFKQWQSFLKDERFINLINDNNLEVCFHLHLHIQEYAKCFEVGSDKINISTWKDHNLQELLNQSIYMITDFSSTAMDFVYCNKRVTYFQFDLDEYRQNHQPFGYFSYKKDGFGTVCYTVDELVYEFTDAINKEFLIQDKYSKRKNGFFAFNDKKNCERTYDAILELIE